MYMSFKEMLAYMIENDIFLSGMLFGGFTALFASFMVELISLFKQKRRYYERKADKNENF